MAAEPLNHLSLRATSVADDLAFVALTDLAKILDADEEVAYRVIGGQMVMVLAARWQLGASLYRVTLDADLGAPPVVVQDYTIVERLADLGYKQVAGDRFTRTVDDIPAGAETAAREAVIDVLLPAYTSRAAQNVKAGDLVATEALGLATALQRPPVIIGLELTRLSGESKDVALSFPDEASALVLKAFATRARFKTTDHTDVWRCLEIANAAGVRPEEFATGEMAQGAAIARSLFADRQGPGMSAIAEDLGMSDSAADQQYTRIRALIEEVLGR
jgi:hypothetical protein